MARIYPQPGTMADRILSFIRENPGASINKIHTQLGINPSPTRTCLATLTRRGLIEDKPDDAGHHYHPKTKGTRA